MNHQFGLHEMLPELAPSTNGESPESGLGEMSTLENSFLGEEEALLGETYGENLHEEEALLGETYGENLGEEESLLGETYGENLHEEEALLGETYGENLHEEEALLGETYGENLGEEESLLGETYGENLGEEETSMHHFGAMEYHEQGEEFFKRAFRKIGRFVKSAAPLLKKIASVAAPLVAKAVGGAFGGPAGAMIASKLASAGVKALGGGGGLQIPGLGGLPMPGGISIPGLFENQESSQEAQEAHHEAQHELTHELAAHEAQAEMIAHFAAQSESHMETEALIGSAVAITLSPRERQALRTLLPALVRAAGIVTVLLRKQRITRPLVRTVPTIVRRTARTLVRGAQRGKPITRARAARVMAAHTRQVLGSPGQCTMVIARNLRYAKPLARPLTRSAISI